MNGVKEITTNLLIPFFYEEGLMSVWGQIIRFWLVIISRWLDIEGEFSKTLRIMAATDTRDVIVIKVELTSHSLNSCFLILYVNKLQSFVNSLGGSNRILLKTALGNLHTLFFNFTIIFLLSDWRRLDWSWTKMDFVIEYSFNKTGENTQTKRLLNVSKPRSYHPSDALMTVSWCGK